MVCRPLFSAGGLGLLEQLKSLLANDPSLVRARKADGLTPLHFAAMGNQLEAAHLLVAAGADRNAVDRAESGVRPVDKVRLTDGHYVTCDTQPLRDFLSPTLGTP